MDAGISCVERIHSTNEKHPCPVERFQSQEKRMKW